MENSITDARIVNIEQDVKKHNELLPQINSTLKTSIEFSKNVLEEQKNTSIELSRINAEMRVMKADVESLEELLKNGNGLVTKFAVLENQVGEIRKSRGLEGDRKFISGVEDRKTLHQGLWALAGAIVGSGIMFALTKLFP